MQRSGMMSSKIWWSRKSSSTTSMQNDMNCRKFSHLSAGTSSDLAAGALDKVSGFSCLAAEMQRSDGTNGSIVQ